MLFQLDNFNKCIELKSKYNRRIYHLFRNIVGCPQYRLIKFLFLLLYFFPIQTPAKVSKVEHQRLLKNVNVDDFLSVVHGQK